MNSPFQGLQDTIAAIATPLGVAGVGIIRVSGAEAFSVVAPLLATPLTLKPRYVHYVSLKHPQTGDALDEGVLIYFKGPQSYTGEDVVELQLHSNPFLLKTILTILISRGARLALPGEFTKRAFIHGKMDLTKAESVIELIHAENAQSHAVAMGHLKGTLYETVSALRVQVLTLMEQVDGSIEFPDEVPELEVAEGQAQLSGLITTLEKMMNAQDFGPWVKSGVKCAIVGSPNAGKSSWLNRILGQDRAIVTPIAGTTRDVIEASITLGGLTFQFSDTAGLRETPDVVEQLGIDRVKRVIQDANLVVWIIDQSKPFSEEDVHCLAAVEKHPYGVILANKADEASHYPLPQTVRDLGWPVIQASAVTGAGLEAFKQFLTENFVTKLEQVDLDYLCSTRQAGCLQAALGHLQQAFSLFDGDVDMVVLSMLLRDALQALGDVTGDALNEEILDGIFSRFCVGK